MISDRTTLKSLSRNQLMEIAKNSGDLIFILDTRRTILYVNENASQHTGYSKQDLLHTKLSLLFRDKYRTKYAAKIFSAISKTGRWTGEIELQRKNASSFVVMAAIIASGKLQDVGNIFLVVCQDIAEQRRISQKLWESGHLTQSMINSIVDGIFVCNRDGTILTCNNALCEMIGLQAEEIVSVKPPLSWMGKTEQQSFMHGLKIFQKEGALKNYTITLRRHDGTSIVASMAFADLREQTNTTQRIIVTVRDVTDVQYVEELRRLQEQLQRLVVDVRRKAERLETLQITNSLVLHNADMVKIFRAVTTGIKKLVQHDLAGIYIYDPEKQSFIAHTLSKQTAFSRKLARFPLPLGEGIIGTASISGKPVCVNNAQQDPRSQYPKGMKPEVEHVIAVPLKGRESIFGVLVVARNRDPLFIEEEMHVVQSFADAATIALENARLYFELQKIQQCNAAGMELTNVKTSDLPRTSGDQSGSARAVSKTTSIKDTK